MDIRLSQIAALLALTVALGAFQPDSTAAKQKPHGAPVARQFRAGAAASNITPPLDEPIIGGWGSPPAEHVHDELYARCLVLDDGRTKLVFVLADSLAMPQHVVAAAKTIIHAKTGIPPHNVLMAATHTHSSISARKGPAQGPSGAFSDYQSFLIRRIADGVRRAVNNLEPARIGFGSATEPNQVFNRRYFMKPGTPTPNPFGGTDQVVMNPGRGNPNIQRAAGPTDPEIAFLYVQSTDARPIALLANYSLHYVGPSAGPVISADYFGVFADRIRQRLGADRLDPPFVGILSNGTSADINNINWPQKSKKRWPPYAKMNQVADDVARAVYHATQEMQFHDWVELDAGQRELTLAARKPSEQQLAYARKILAKPADAPQHHRRERTYANRVLALHESPNEIAIPLQAFRIGDLAVTAIPFEVFVEIGLQLKADSPFARTFTISHANGSHGYLPTVRHHALGGYETWLGTNRVEIQAAPKITATLLDILNQLHPEHATNR